MAQGVNGLSFVFFVFLIGIALILFRQLKLTAIYSHH